MHLNSVCVCMLCVCFCQCVRAGVGGFVFGGREGEEVMGGLQQFYDLKLQTVLCWIQDAPPEASKQQSNVSVISENMYTDNMSTCTTQCIINVAYLKVFIQHITVIYH